MSVEHRAYDNEDGDPVVVYVVKGTFDVSRFLNLLAQGRCEDLDRVQRLAAQVRRHNGGRAALKLMKDHGGADFTADGELSDLVKRAKPLAQAITQKDHSEAAEAIRQLVGVLDEFQQDIHDDQPMPWAVATLDLDVLNALYDLPGVETVRADMEDNRPAPVGEPS